MAHDFNYLLTAISGHCDLLLLRYQASDPDYSDLIQISQNANRAASPVGQFLAFSRKQNLKPQALDLRDTMADLAALQILDDKALKVDLFVTDVIMPGMNGPTGVRQALKERPDTCVVFMSGWAEEGRAEK